MAERREDVIRRLRRKGWSPRQARKLAATPLGANAAPPFRGGGAASGRRAAMNVIRRLEREGQIDRRRGIRTPSDLLRASERQGDRFRRDAAVYRELFGRYPEGEVQREAARHYSMGRRLRPSLFDPSELAGWPNVQAALPHASLVRRHGGALRAAFDPHSSPSHHVGPCSAACRAGRIVHYHARRVRRRMKRTRRTR